MLARSCLARRATQPSPPTTTNTILILKRLFHSSPSHNDNTASLPNHYETLSLPPSASPPEIKKQFYKLSKSHHPDLHPNDSTASSRFVKISEAYAVLGSPEKRARYDRDYTRAFAPSHGSARGATPHGSFSSASADTPFGGRPASGLSRRRTQFRGPPPSFYRSGGWGEHSEKRAEQARKSSHTHEAQGRAQSGAQGPGRNSEASEAGSSAGPGGGQGPGAFTTGFDNDVPHFDHSGHYRTQSNIERTRHKARRKVEVRREEGEESVGGSTLFNFIWVTTLIVGLGWATSGVFGGGGNGGRRRVREERGDG